MAGEEVRWCSATSSDGGSGEGVRPDKIRAVGDGYPAGLGQLVAGVLEEEVAAVRPVEGGHEGEEVGVTG